MSDTAPDAKGVDIITHVPPAPPVPPPVRVVGTSPKLKAFLSRVFGTEPAAPAKDYSHLPTQQAQIIEAGRRTRFQKGNIPKHVTDPDANKPYSVRRQMRILAEVDINVDIIDEEFARLRKETGAKTKLKKLAALRVWERMVKQAPANMINNFLDNLEGKLVQPTQELPPDVPIPEDFTTEEEALAAFNRHGRK